MKCRRCSGSGVVRLRHARPGTETRIAGEVARKGDGWSEGYGGGYRHWVPPYCLYPDRECPVCDGTGQERDKPNPVAGYRIHMDDWGWVTERSGIPDTAPPVDDVW